MSLLGVLLSFANNCRERPISLFAQCSRRHDLKQYDLVSARLLICREVLWYVGKDSL